MSKILKLVVITISTVLAAFIIAPHVTNRNFVRAEDNNPAAIESSAGQDDFDQKAAVAKLKEEIKGKEQQPAETVFKNIQSLKGIPAGRLLAIMEFGYARSLGVNCTHCHTPENWAAEDKAKKQIARDMSAMVGKINSDLLAGIKNLKGPKPTINCTTCHRGEVIPALNLPAPRATPAANTKPTS